MTVSGFYSGTCEWREKNSSETFLLLQILYEPLASSVKSCQKKTPRSDSKDWPQASTDNELAGTFILIKSPRQERRLWGQAGYGGAVCSWSYSLFMESFEIIAAGVDI